ncbi:HNH endonuclease signature motif containing protein [Mycobacterium sp. 050134]|uniref:HNH endonuclease signature motif containing protein n=1 Tax=Mycobacterium sp. 050134 TaxID=3096111 RepID=UPI002ED8D222
MGSSDRDEIEADIAALQSAVSRILEHSYDALTCPERLTLLARLEVEGRRLRVPGHQLLNQLAEQADPEQLGGRLPQVVADRLGLTRAEANRRVAEAADLGPRRALTGQPLPPLLTGTAAAERDGRLGPAHIRIIRRFVHQLPTTIDVGTRECAEAHLARLATAFRPDHLAGLADALTDCLNPDGTYTDTDRARRRSLTLGRQGPDGMSELRALLTPEARATLEAVLAKLAAPGQCNPDDEQPVIDGPADQDTARRDTRSAAQRHHDALNTALRALLASGKLGQHNGLPATIIITTTLADLQSATGTGRTGGGSRLPISDVIRLARHAYHYLAVFDDAKPLALYHTKRLASPGQRLILYAKDRGCTAPGCDQPGYYCEVHHVTDWATTHTTNINQLTFACRPHHRLLDHGYTTRKHPNGTTQWIPPPHQDHGQPRTNTHHHPEKLLSPKDDEDDEAP